MNAAASEGGWVGCEVCRALIERATTWPPRAEGSFLTLAEKNGGHTNGADPGNGDYA